MNRNALLLVAIVIVALAGYFVINNNVSLKNLVRNDGYTPMGKPSKAWENQWEIERTR